MKKNTTKLLSHYKGEYDINDAPLVSASLRMQSFKQQLQTLLFAAIEQGSNLQDAIHRNADAIVKLREEYTISAAEEAHVLSELSSKSGALASAIDDLIEQLADITQLQAPLDQSTAQAYIGRYLDHQAQRIFAQCLDLIAGMEAEDEDWQNIALRLRNSHPCASQLAIQNSVNMPTGFVRAMASANTIPLTAPHAGSLEKTLLRLKKLDDIYLRLVIASVAFQQAYPWAEDLLRDAQALLPAEDQSLLKAKPAAASQAQPLLRLSCPTGQSALVEASCSFGRSADNDWALNYPEASRQHFRIAQTAGQFYCEDLNSAKGTTVNGQHLQGTRTPLAATNTISITFTTPPITAEIVKQPSFPGSDLIHGFVALAATPLGRNCPPMHSLDWPAAPTG